MMKKVSLLLSVLVCLAAVSATGFADEPVKAVDQVICVKDSTCGEGSACTDGGPSAACKGRCETQVKAACKGCACKNQAKHPWIKEIQDILLPDGGHIALEDDVIRVADEVIRCKAVKGEDGKVIITCDGGKFQIAKGGSDVKCSGQVIIAGGDGKVRTFKIGEGDCDVGLTGEVVITAGDGKPARIVTTTKEGPCEICADHLVIKKGLAKPVRIFKGSGDQKEICAECIVVSPKAGSVHRHVPKTVTMHADKDGLQEVTELIITDNEGKPRKLKLLISGAGVCCGEACGEECECPCGGACGDGCECPCGGACDDGCECPCGGTCDNKCPCSCGGACDDVCECSDVEEALVELHKDLALPRVAGVKILRDDPAAHLERAPLDSELREAVNDLRSEVQALHQIVKELRKNLESMNNEKVEKPRARKKQIRF